MIGCSSTTPTFSEPSPVSDAASGSSNYGAPFPRSVRTSIVHRRARWSRAGLRSYPGHGIVNNSAPPSPSSQQPSAGCRRGTNRCRDAERRRPVRRRAILEARHVSASSSTGKSRFTATANARPTMDRTVRLPSRPMIAITITIAPNQGRRDARHEDLLALESSALRMTYDASGSSSSTRRRQDEPRHDRGSIATDGRRQSPGQDRRRTSSPRKLRRGSARQGRHCGEIGASAAPGRAIACPPRRFQTFITDNDLDGMPLDPLVQQHCEISSAPCRTRRARGCSPSTTAPWPRRSHRHRRGAARAPAEAAPPRTPESHPARAHRAVD